MPHRTYNALFVGTGNAARSQMAEALLNFMAKGRVRAFSAGSHPEAKVQPLAAELIARFGFSKETLRTKSWDEFAGPGAPEMDFVITLRQRRRRSLPGMAGSSGSRALANP